MLKFYFHLSSNAVGGEGDNSRSLSRGEIYIEAENEFFPCLGWSDRILSSVSMWIGNTMRMVASKDGEQKVTNYFMDGPYSFVLQKIEKDLISIKFLRRVGDGEKEEIPMLTMVLKDYCTTLLNVAENVERDLNFQSYGKEQERINFKQSVTMLKVQMEYID